MPGTNLTREEAATRAALLDVTSYSIDLDLTTGDKTFASTTTIRFTATEPGAETFADLVGAEIHEVSLNGVALDPAEVYADHRIRLADLQEHNELVVKADAPGEIHVHTKPDEQEFEYAEGTTTLPLTIDKPGLVDIESHDLEKVIVQLEVE